MNRNPMHIFALLATLAILALGLAGCGGDEPATATAPPAPPPAPPPFQPQPVEVTLGENGGTATLMTTEDDGFTLNGEAFEGGAENPVEGEGGRMYVLTRGEDGMWTAAFQPMEVTVDLGASEERATLMTTEAGGFTLGGEPFESGGTAMNAAGESYTLTLAAGEDGAMAWSAMHVPRMETVPLGQFGGTVELTTAEDGTWMIGGDALSADGSDTYTVGDRTYSLALGGEEGMTWMATFAPEERTVLLGKSGETVTLMTTEAGGWMRGDADVDPAGFTAVAANGNAYELALGDDGRWMATFAPQPVEVALGASGETVTLMTAEDGTFTMDGAAFGTGGTAMNAAAESYTLTLGADGTWSAMHMPRTQTVALGGSGDSVDLMTNEAGMWMLGGTALQADGSDRHVEADRTYSLALGDDGAWMAAFVPMPVSVALGASGEAVTLMTAEDGTFTLDGAAFASGGEALNSFGESYALTLDADGLWAAMHMPRVQTVALGASGDSVDLATAEDGMWMLGGTALQADGSDRHVEADRTYSLALGDDGAWMAAFVPVEVPVTLGITGETVTLMTTEAGGWARDGSSVDPAGHAAEATNGNAYELAIGADGRWMATFVPRDVPVALGASGETVTLMTAETPGTFTLGGLAVASGATTMNSAEESYTLTLGADGMWSAMHVPRSQDVRLGAEGGTRTLMSNERGGWRLDGVDIFSDATVEGGTNDATGAANTYRLTLDEATDTWSADYEAATMTIGNTGGLQAMAREDGSGFDVGETMSLTASGTGDITDPEGGMFRVVMDADGMLMGTRFDMDMANAAMKMDAIPDSGDAPTLSADDRDTAGINEKNTMLNALGASFSMGELLGSGSDTVTGPNVVAKARGEIVKIRDRVRQLVALRADDGIEDTAFTTQIDNQWDAADTQIEKIFGGNRQLERTVSASRVNDAFDRLVAALSDVDAFIAATDEDGPGKLQGFHDLSTSNATATFNRLEHTATARLGSLGSTRYGAAVFNGLGGNNARGGFGDAEKAQAFAWSTMQNVRRASDAQASGYATYQGRTLAADQEGNLYSGDIALEVRFTRMAVDARIDGLADAATQEPWEHGLGGLVTGIVLPTATLTRRGSWTVASTEANSGRLQYAARAGGEPDRDFGAGDAEFAGQLLGRGDASGSEAIGTWKIAPSSNVTLAGGFGTTLATRSTRDRAPAVADDLAALGKEGTVFARLGIGPGPALPAIRDIADNAATQDTNEKVDIEPDSAFRPAIAATNNGFINTNNTKFKYNPPPMDTPAAAEYVSGNYEPQRAAVLADEDWEDTKGNWVEDAHAAITARLAQLRRVIALDNADASEGDQRFANDQRQRLFTEIKQQIQTVFGTSGATAAGVTINTGVLSPNGAGPITHEAWTAHVDYPVNSSGVAQDAGVLAQIQDVLAAFAGKEAFAAAFDSGGLFEAQKANRAGTFADGYPTPGAIFDRPRGKLSVAARATDYTRFGGWSHQVSDFAAAALAAQSYDDATEHTYTNAKTGVETTGTRARGAEFGAFAYSPLDPVAPYSTGSRLYPAQTADVTATYAGRTAAAQGDLFYTGTVEAKVFWDAAAVTGSRVTVEISGLEDTESGDPLQFGYVREGFAPAGVVDVESLMWTAEVTNSGTVQFASSTDVTVAVDSVSGTPNWRPVYGGELRGADVFRHFRRLTNPDQLRIRRSASVYWVLRAGTGADDYGELSFLGINSTNAGDAAPTVTSGAAFDTAEAAFEAGQDTLDYPTHVINGPTVQPAGQTGNTQIRGSSILLFKDGSTLHIDRYFNHDMAPIGSEANPPSGLQAFNFDGTPLLSDRPDLVYTNYGQSFSRAFLTLDGLGATIGQGRPSMTPAQLATTFLTDGKYVNVAETDATARDSALNGMFVGADQDGPLGLIGTWSLTGGAFGLGTERAPIRGAFGADIQP